jgi:hypothetical protein
LTWLETKGALAMATQIVMDHNGDSRYNFDPKDASALLQAEERFKGLTGGSSLSELFRCEEITRIVTVNPSGFIVWLAARHATPKNILES